MKIVITKNYRQYREYLRENNLTPNDARYISRAEQLHGLQNVEVVRYGQWWLSPVAYDDYLKLLETEKKTPNQGGFLFPPKRAENMLPARIVGIAIGIVDGDRFIRKGFGCGVKHEPFHFIVL